MYCVERFGKTRNPLYYQNFMVKTYNNCLFLRFGSQKTMKIKEQIGKSIAALLLFAALVLPSAIKFVHVFEDHEHFTCSAVSTHIHKSIIECDLCDFNYVSFDYTTAKFPNVHLPKVLLRVVSMEAPLKYNSFKITNTQLRAPPIFS